MVGCRRPFVRPLFRPEQPYSDVVPTTAFWTAGPGLLRLITITFSGQLTPVPNLLITSWSSVIHEALRSREARTIFAGSTNNTVVVNVQKLFPTVPDEPFVAYDGIANDLYDSLGKPIAPFSIELLPGPP